MRYIFVTDDQEYKREDVVRVLQGIFPDAKVLQYECACEFIDCIKRTDKLASALKDEPNNCLIVTDMRMPYREGGKVCAEAGYRLLSNISHELVSPAIVVSSESIDEEKAKDLYPMYIGSIEYSVYRTNSDVYVKLIEDWRKTLE